MTQIDAALDPAQLTALRAIKWPADSHPLPSMQEMLSAVPTLDAMADVPAGTPVLLRGDLDVPLAEGEVTDDVRLRSMLPTIEFGLQRGWRWILIGHTGRDPDRSLAPVGKCLERLCETTVSFVPEWFDESTVSVEPQAQQTAAQQADGSLILLENARKYEIERALWSVTAEEFASMGPKLIASAHAVRDSLSHYLVNEALSASNLDFSSCVLPLAMSGVAFGRYTRAELSLALEELSKVDCVVFSGVKANKLDDLEDIVATRPLQLILVGGALAMALRKAQAELSGEAFTYGAPEREAEHVTHMPVERIAQGKRILEHCSENNVEVLLPVDYRLDDESVSREIPSDRRQLDIGPETIERFTQALHSAAASGSVKTAYLNGSVGVFEDPRFAAGTKGVVDAFCSLTSNGVRTFVGGGDAHVSLMQFASESDITHAFTAGGTILKVMKSSPIGYIASSYFASLAHGRE